MGARLKLRDAPFCTLLQSVIAPELAIAEAAATTAMPSATCEGR